MAVATRTKMPAADDDDSLVALDKFYDETALNHLVEDLIVENNEIEWSDEEKYEPEK